MESDSYAAPMTLPGHLKAHYGIVLANAETIAKGETALLQRVLTKSGDRYFLKIYLPELFATKHDEIRRNLELLEILASKVLLQCVVSPISSNEGQLLTFIDDIPAAIFPYVDGTDLDEVEPTLPLLTKVGAMLGEVHEAVEYVPADLVKRDSFWMGRVTRIREHLQTLEHSSLEGNEAISALRHAIEPKMHAILADVQTTEKLALLLNAKKPPCVLTHGDAYLGNMRLDRQGRLYFLDWDAVRIAPRERDLHLYGIEGQFRYTPSQAEALLRGYSEVTAVETLDVVTLAFYRYKRYLEDIEQRIDRILGRKYNSQRAKHAVGEVEWILTRFQLTNDTLRAVSKALARE